MLSNKNLFLSLLLILLSWVFFNSEIFLENNELKAPYNLNQTRSVSSIETFKQNFSTALLKPKAKSKQVKTKTLFETFKLQPKELEDFNNRYSDEPSGFTMELSGLNVDFEVFKKAKHPLKLPDKIKIPLPNGKILSTHQTRVDYRGEGDFVWVGQVDGKLDEFVHLSFYKSVLFGGINTPNDTYKIERLLDDKYFIRKVDEGLLSPLVDDAIEMPGGGESEKYSRRNLNDEALRFMTKAKSASPPLNTSKSIANAQTLERVIIDLLVVYTPGALEGFGGHKATMARINAHIALNNTIHNNSQTGVSVRLTQAVEIALSEEPESAQSAIVYMRASPEIQSLREETKSDLVMMIGALKSECARGELGSYLSVMNISRCSSGTFAHELGHNIGCEHNKSFASSRSPTSYNFGYVLDNGGVNNRNDFFDEWPSSIGARKGTIMAYASKSELYFSSAEPVRGVARGSATMDNARYIRENASRTAAYYQSPDNRLSSPYITSQPESVTVPVNDNLSLSVSASGEGPLNYQWYKGDAIISNQKDRTLLINNVSESHEGIYKVKVTNAYGLVYSNFVTVSIREPFVTISHRPAITLQPQHTTVNVNDNLSLSVISSGASLHYQWYKNTSSRSKVLVGQTSSLLSISKVSSFHEGWYVVRVRNSFGYVDSNWVKVSIDETLNEKSPVITSQPKSTTVQVNEDLSLSVGASGSFLSYQWYKNTSSRSKVLVGQTSSLLSISEVSSSHEGWYVARVYNPYGYIDSNWVKVNIAKTFIRQVPVITSQPESITVQVNEDLSLSVGASGSSLSYQWYQNTLGQIKALLGETNNSLSLSKVSSSHEGWYLVRVRNSYGYVDSNWVKVHVD